MSCFIEITNDLSELEHYSEIIKILKLSNKILKNGVDHLYDEKKIEVFINGELKTELEEEKSNRALSVEIVEFFDHVAKQKRYVFHFARSNSCAKFVSFEFRNNRLSIKTKARQLHKQNIFRLRVRENFQTRSQSEQKS